SAIPSTTTWPARTARGAPSWTRPTRCPTSTDRTTSGRAASESTRRHRVDDAAHARLVELRPRVHLGIAAPRDERPRVIRANTAARHDHEPASRMRHEPVQLVSAVDSRRRTAESQHSSNAGVDQRIEPRQLIVDIVERAMEGHRELSGAPDQLAYGGQVDLARMGEHADHDHVCAESSHLVDLA